MDEAKPPGLRINQIFLVRAQFEHRDDFLALPPNHQVEVEVQIQTSAQVEDEGKVGIIAMAITSNDELNPVYRFRVEMAGIVGVDPAAPNMALKDYLARIAPVMMMPFLRETVANITGRGRFGPLYVNPVNLTGLKLEQAKPEEPEGEKKPAI